MNHIKIFLVECILVKFLKVLSFLNKMKQIYINLLSIHNKPKNIKKKLQMNWAVLQAYRNTITYRTDYGICL